MSRVLLHEDYDPWTISNDICLLEVSMIMMMIVMANDDYDHVMMMTVFYLEVRDEMVFNDHVGKAVLPAPGQEYECGARCTETGWSDQGESDLLQVMMIVVMVMMMMTIMMMNLLQKLEMPVVCDDECRGSYGSSAIADSMLCAGYMEGGAGACLCQVRILIMMIIVMIIMHIVIVMIMISVPG